MGRSNATRPAGWDRAVVGLEEPYPFWTRALSSRFSLQPGAVYNLVDRLNLCCLSQKHTKKIESSFFISSCESSSPSFTSHLCDPFLPNPAGLTLSHSAHYWPIEAEKMPFSSGHVCTCCMLCKGSFGTHIYQPVQ